MRGYFCIGLIDFVLAGKKLTDFICLFSTHDFDKNLDMELSHKEFITILKEKDKYEKMKENVKNVSEKLEDKTENMRIDNIN